MVCPNCFLQICDLTNRVGHDMTLTLAEAHRMMQAARAQAEELHVKVSVAVCDAGGISWLLTGWKGRVP
jgi:hypothetical protein